MRIIGGTARGRRLAAPRTGRPIRPTTDRVRESLFAILGDLDQALVLDGFAGSGALGLEALSRGAAHCVFLDPLAAAAALVEENIQRCGFGPERARLLRLPFGRGLDTLAAEPWRPDLVLLDPPYDRVELARGALDALAESPAILPDCLVVLEQRTDTPAPHDPSGRLLLEDERTFGDTALRFYRRSAVVPPAPDDP